MPLYQRREGEEHPCWKVGPLKIRLPLIHLKWEWPEAIQALVMVVIVLGMIPTIEEYFGAPYEVALAMTVISGFALLSGPILGLPLVPGWITPAIPLMLAYLEPWKGTDDAIRAVVAVQILVAAIFLILGLTGLGQKLVDRIPMSLKAGLILGAGIAAIIGEIEPGAIVPEAPISIIIGFVLCIYIMFSISFKNLRQNFRFANILSNGGLLPGLLIAIIIAFAIGEFPRPSIEWGLNNPAFVEMMEFTPFAVGFPNFEMLYMAIPTAFAAYVIAFGDVIVGTTLINEADDIRKDEDVDVDQNRINIVTSLRNFMHAFIAPWPGLMGPIWTPMTAVISERYKFGRNAMDSIYSGAATFMFCCVILLFISPVLTFFQPVLDLAFSMTLLLTGWVCLRVGMEQLGGSVERSVAGTMGIVLALYGATYGIAAGIVLHVLMERDLFTTKIIEKNGNGNKNDDDDSEE
ncbi:putative sulfate/molybdate transporter [Natranaerofaba carboxydovora]|uniref:putative sulfate/molybdate transporter n=1 Tax=Natranaerofaba carboxydovora TaxID=2742683 RepID=UPI001F1377BA|nr:putative sulfate/molybdate transporter [Natranaerofaba carboxydovora]UMZ74033.1 hypothetical protein ACONDI_01606 [Natranaerofaba carboxydovora]